MHRLAMLGGPDPPGVVITGAAGGIGKACALHLDRLGFTVFAGVRKEADLEPRRQVGSERLRPLRFDVTDPDSLSAAAEIVDSELSERGLAGLVNNAGVSIAGPLEFFPLDALRRQLEVNVIGQVAATQAFLPALRRDRGRVVMIGSVCGRMVFPFSGPYCASKFALESLTSALRVELRPWGIPVAIVEPGAVATSIWDKSVADLDALMSTLPGQVAELYGPGIAGIKRFAARRSKAGVSAEAVASAVGHALTARKPRERYVVGRDARVVELLRRAPLSERALDSLLLRATRLGRAGS
jgi:NAD(P)-dependent dehydrogenase (short-subunit alcohol dehydrogenase family)